MPEKLSTITPATKRHFRSDLAYGDVALVAGQDGPMDERVEIRDGTALTIASWWQSAGYEGRTFAALASGLPVEIEDLLDEIRTVRTQHANVHPTDLTALDCLATWAINHPSREVQS